MDGDLEAVWAAWCLCQTQLRHAFGGVAGLDFTAVKVVLDAAGIGLDRWMLDGLQILERDLLRQQAEETKDGGDGENGC